MHPVIQGAQVRTLDWETIGRVVEVRGEAFRVDVRTMPEYWLPMSAVTWGDPKMIRLQFPRDEVDSHTVDAPELTRPTLRLVRI